MTVDKKERKKALIIGDSMVKGIKRWKINKQLRFTNVSVNCLKHYSKPPKKKNPNAEIVIIRTGTNDPSSDSTPTELQPIL